MTRPSSTGAVADAAATSSVTSLAAAVVDLEHPAVAATLSPAKTLPRKRTATERSVADPSRPARDHVQQVGHVRRALVDPRSPRPSARTLAASKWIGLGSRRSAAISFIFSGVDRLDHERRKLLARLRRHARSFSRGPRGKTKLVVLTATGSRRPMLEQRSSKVRDVEHAGPAALLALDLDDPPLDGVLAPDLERRGGSRKRCSPDHHAATSACRAIRSKMSWKVTPEPWTAA